MADFQARSNGHSTLFLSGELDLATVPAFEFAMVMAAAHGGPITLDVSKTTFMDSTGVGAIVKAAKGLPSGCIVLHGVHGEVRRVIELLAIQHAPNMHVVPCDVLV
jgi:anti-sigma B factor antagonist